MTARHILVVDDEPDIRVLLKEILDDEGFETTLAENAAQAREARQRQVRLAAWHAAARRLIGLGGRFAVAGTRFGIDSLRAIGRSAHVGQALRLCRRPSGDGETKQAQGQYGKSRRETIIHGPH